MASSSNLGPQFENYVSELVKTGRYDTRDDVLRQGVRLVEEQEKRLAILDAAISRGLADADAGRTKPLREVGNRLATKYRKMAEDAGT
jgi:antitoxin ParD1/3/4